MPHQSPEPEPTPRPEVVYEKAIRRMLLLARPLAIIASVGIGISVCVGLRGIFAVEGGLTGWLVPIAVSLIFTILLAGLWHMVLGTAVSSNVMNVKVTWIVLALGGGLFAVQGATSMPFLASAIGGRDAVQYHQALKVEELSTHANALTIVADMQRQIGTALEAEQRSVGDLLSREIAGKVRRVWLARGRWRA